MKSFTLNIANQTVAVTQEIKTGYDETEGKHTKFTFPNGYAVSVIASVVEGVRYSGCYTRGPKEFELAILLPNDEVAYETGIVIKDEDGDEMCIDGDVCAYINRSQVNEILRQVANL